MATPFEQELTELQDFNTAVAQHLADPDTKPWGTRRWEGAAGAWAPLVEALADLQSGAHREALIAEAVRGDLASRQIDNTLDAYLEEVAGRGGAPVRIAEIGALTSERLAVLQRHAGVIATYVELDAAQSGQQLESPFLQHLHLDQYSQGELFDLVVLSAIPGASRSFAELLEHARALLQPEGILLVSHWNKRSHLGALLSHLQGEEGDHGETLLEKAGFTAALHLGRDTPWVVREVVVAQPVAVESERPAPAAHQGAPASADLKLFVTRRLSECLARAVGLAVEAITPNTPFQDFGVDSLVAVALIKSINREFGINLTTITLFDYSCVADLAAHLLRTQEVVLAAHPGLQGADIPASATERAPEPQDLNKKSKELNKSKEPKETKSRTRRRRVSAAEREAASEAADEVGLAAAIGGRLLLSAGARVLLRNIGGCEYRELQRQLTARGARVSLDAGADELFDAIIDFAADRESAVEPAGLAPGGHYLLVAGDAALDRTVNLALLDDNQRFECLSVGEIGREETRSATAAAAHAPGEDAIAIIGASGRFAQADDLAELWRHLAAGRDLVTTATRWNLEEGIPAPRRDRICRHGSFLCAHDEFDPAFFNISATEATYMDPQQRVFLEEAWRTLEDSGYAGEALKGCACGVYVGCNSGDYCNLFEGEAIPAQAFWGNAASILPARISYYLDLKGPALAIDTACSSSLVAIHTACQALMHGEVDYALAGGVFIQSTAEFYQYSNRAGMLSPSGRCHSFDARADGFVPGEGAGVVLLKRLRDALADGDHIHGVIRGSACNQDGATNGITAPSALSQEQLERQVYDRCGISADSIQLVEAHGTGTSLGDPIEHQALTRAFRRDTERRQFCALGSIKSNLGHTATAAGVSGLLKILLAMKHRQLPPSIHFQQGNPNIDFENSPFYVNTELRDWPQPAGGVRRAALSSFGFSGTNVHMVIDEAPATTAASPARPAHLVALSAVNAAQLQRMVSRLCDHLRAHPDTDLGHLSHTLLVGRKHLTERLALVATSTADLLTRLDGWLAGNSGNLLRGDLKQQAALTDPERLQRGRAQLSAGSDPTALAELAELYCLGAELPWGDLFGPGFGRISLPVYPFARQRYWVTKPVKAERVAVQLHPLLHEDISAPGRTAFRSHFSGAEVFLRDHRVRGQSVLPGTAYLEMVRAAFGRAEGTLVLSDVEWRTPLTVAQPQSVEISLQQAGAELSFSVHSGSAQGESVLHSCGRARWQAEVAAPAAVDLEHLRGQLPRRLSAAECYGAFDRLGLDYGPSHRGLQELWCGECDGQRQVLARLRGEGTFEGLDPGLLDAAFQGALGLLFDEAQLAVPQSLASCTLHRLPATAAWAWIRQCARDAQRVVVDLDLYDDQGCCLELRQLSLHRLGEGRDVQLSGYSAQWRTCAPVAAADRPTQVLLAEVALSGPVDYPVTVLRAAAEDPAARYQQLSEQLLGHLQQRLQADPASRLHLVVTPELAGLGGLLRSAQREYPDSRLHLIETHTDLDAAQLQALVAQPHAHLRWRDGRSEYPTWQRQTLESAGHPWRDGGVYLITGGAGGLGLIFAQDIARQARRPALILTGRRPAPGIDAKLQQLRALGAEVEYRPLDVSDAEAVAELIAAIDQRHGALHGILHCAGVLADSGLQHKSAAQLQRVLAPKVAGICHLDQASAHLKLDLFLACSSAAGALGNAGQADYAAANAFMDLYLERRQSQVAQGQRHGLSLSLAWPLWAEGGMGLDAHLQAQLRQRTGLVPMPTSEGLRALYHACHQRLSSLLVLFGETRRIESTFLSEVSIAQAPAVSVETAASAASESALELIRPAFAAVLGIAADQVDPDTSFDKFGMDSIMVMNLNEHLEAIFGSLPKTLMFEYRTPGELARYLAAEFPALCAPDIDGGARPAEAEMAAAPAIEAEPARQLLAAEPQGIAIIGLAGRYPGARNLTEFWNNLAQGRDCITDLPQGRWPVDRDYKGAVRNCRGGFLDGVDEFDPLFFNINPREAEFMDPQERLFLQCVHATLEDAGYTRESLARNSRGAHSTFVHNPVGVYVGVMYEEYQLYGAQASLQGQPVALTGNPASIANRVSYYFDFHGPSIAVDTMCSSSITAIHLACEALERGDCAAAVAGGVNVSIHPNKYLFLQQGNFTSSDGRCASFGEGGDGYVPGEGVGAVLLKPLARALEDGDRIYGVIRGSALNHGGKTNGYTVPNPNAQAEVIHQAYRRAGVSCAQVGYIEAHGTGTSLGDPIEIAGLAKAFEAGGGRVDPCAIGSVKSNIGHLESAAGIAGLTKILLQMQHRKLVPSLHSRQLNRNIDFSRTPFQVQQELADWPVAPGARRLAGISSFGAGGANAHLIVQEYPLPTPVALAPRSEVILLSAATPEQLREQAANLLGFLQTAAVAPRLLDVAFTLAIGRRHLECRAAMTVASLEELAAGLQRWADGEIPAAGAEMDRSRRQALQAQLARGDWDEAVSAWCAGLDLDWQSLFSGRAARRIGLPTYAFARERYWFTPALVERAAAPQLRAPEPVLRRVRETDFFFADHRIRGRRLLPAAIYLEWVRAAALESDPSGTGSVRLENLLWLQPFEEQDVEGDLAIHFERRSDGLRFRVTSARSERAGAAHCEGDIGFAPSAAADRVDLAAEVAAGSWRSFDQSAIYGLFDALQFSYGPRMRAVEAVFVDGDNAIARLCIPDFNADHHLHPAALDGAFQSVIALLDTGKGPTRAGIPMGINSLDVFAPCSREMWVRLRRVSGAEDALQRFDLQLYDTSGRCCADIRGFALRMFQVETPAVGRPDLYVPIWQTAEVTSPVRAVSGRQLFLLFGDARDTGTLAAQIRERQPASSVHCVNTEEPQAERRWQDFYRQTFLHLQQLLRNPAQLPVQLHLVGLWSAESLDGHCLGALSALGKSATWENPALAVRTARVEPSGYQRFLQDLAVDTGAALGETDVVYTEDEKKVKRWARAPEPLLARTSAARQGGVYLITGGAGGLGEIFARHLAGSAGSVLILTGRSAPSQRTASLLRDLEQLGCEAEYHQCDVTCEQDVERLIFGILTEHGRLNGLYHSAGAKEDGFILRKDADAAPRVLGAKLDGLVNLDKATRNLLLDYFVVFSSISAVTGNVGQADYAFANGFMDGFMAWRAQLVKRGERYGASLSVNWPLWRSEGMQVDAEVARSMARAGILPLEAHHGLAALERALLTEAPQVAVAGEGLRQFFTSVEENGAPDPVTATDETSVLLEMISSVLGVAAEDLSVGDSWADLGLGEAALAALRDSVNRFYGSQFSLGQLSSMQTIEGLQQALANRQGEPAPQVAASANAQVQRDIEEFLRTVLAEELKVPMRRLSADAEFERYGIDSVAAMRLTSRLEARFGPQPKTLFFQHTSVRALAAHLSGTVAGPASPEVVSSAVGSPVVSAPVAATAAAAEPAKPAVLQPQVAAAAPADMSQISTPPQAEPAGGASRSRSAREQSRDVAIIGVAGRFPQAANVEEFWQLLEQGADCVTEIPRSRWQLERFFDEDRAAEETSYSKWGAFIEDVDKFDAEFFNLSDLEAAYLDPQERIFLEVVWELLESAGYTRARLRDSFAGDVGLFAGAMYQQYRNFHFAGAANAIISASSYSSMVNRVSHFFDLRGPSVAIDTMCSTAVTCLHMACEALLRGETRMAIAGAANLSLHPHKYIGLSQGQMLGSHPHSRSFAEGDGYIPAECVGAVLLKPLAAAIADGDEILGVIKGIAINHNGRTQAYAVPSLSAQTRVIRDCLDKAGMTAGDIHYIESAANGSALGDPIEMGALNAVFATVDRAEPIALGSVKTNIGHGEAASGITQLAKVLMQYKHRRLAPNPLPRGVRASLGLDGQRLKIQEGGADWRTQAAPRRSLITSFGAGGSNSAMVVEEYPRAAVTERACGPQIMVFSARNLPRLRALAQRYCAYLDSRESLDLADLAAGLQRGREAMDCRLAFTAASVDAVKQRLGAFLASSPADLAKGSADFFYGDASGPAEDFNRLLGGDMTEMIGAKLAARGEWDSLAELWTRGVDIAWGVVNPQGRPMSGLPTYAFERVRHWLEEAAEQAPQTGRTKAHSLQQPAVEAPSPEAVAEPAAGLPERVRNHIVAFISRDLKIKAGDITPDSNLRKFGVDSVTLMRFVRSVREEFGFKIAVKDLSRINTVNEFTNHICSLVAESANGVQAQTGRLPAAAPAVARSTDDGLAHRLDAALYGYDPAINSIDDLINMVDAL
jgi:acyl transferase domain-containing protein/acyl carrier protein